VTESEDKQCTQRPSGVRPDGTARERYQKALAEIPPPGRGEGCHPKQLGVANLGARAGLSPERVFADLRSHIPAGGRDVSDKEIRDTVEKAFGQKDKPIDLPVKEGTSPGKGGPSSAFDGAKARRMLIARGQGIKMGDLVDASPVRLSDEYDRRDAVTALRALYDASDALFIGSRYDAGPENVLTAGDWISRFLAGAPVPELICPNPLSGEQGPRKDGQPSYRADSCVARFRFAVVEFDTLSLEEQVAFWGVVRLPIAALIFSGKRSIHAWVRVDCQDEREWHRRVKQELYGQLFEPLGVDKNCKNAGRLSRMPGALRDAKEDAFQFLLYLNPAGGGPCLA